jgi:hypothetical protein
MLCSFGLLWPPRSEGGVLTQTILLVCPDYPVLTARARSIWHTSGTADETNDGCI